MNKETIVKCFNTLSEAARHFNGNADDHDAIRKSTELLGSFLKEVLSESEDVKECSNCEDCSCNKEEENNEE